jgi:hypothetical protein
MAKRVLVASLAIFASLFISISVFAASGCDGAGNCYIRASATGSGNGSDWNNAWTTLSAATFTRGVVYYISAGNYTGRNFTTADSGTSTIELRAATSADHGTSTGWSDSFVGQALVTGESTVTTDYWIFNGNGVRDSGWQSGYLLKFWNKTNMTSGCNFHASGNNLRWDYIDMQGTTNITDNSSTTGDNNICDTSSESNWYVGHSYLHETGNTQMQINAGSSSGLTFEYNWIYKNHTAQNSNHDEAFSMTWSNATIRYNVFQDICSSGVITDAAGGTPSLSNWDIYGNIFFWDPTYAAINGTNQLATLDDGIIGLFGENWSGYLHFYNNTIAGIYNSHMDAQGVGAGTGIGPDVPSGTVMDNNLWWDDGYVTGVTGSYNAYWAGPAVNSQFSGGGSNSYVNSSSSTNPFTNWTAFTEAGFELTSSAESAIPAGLSMSSPYNIDMLGIPRGSDGTWDRGALQLGSQSSAPNPPQNLTVSVQ